MCKFEEIGVSYQQNSASPREADRRFSVSCRICSEKGIHVECSRCAIAAAHQFALDCFSLTRKLEARI